MKEAVPALILASGSPRRKALLEQAGLKFEVVIAPVEEISPDHLTVREAVLWNAALKGAAVARMQPEACIIAADTLVALEGRALGKPRDAAEATEMLRALAGREHQVFSGVWLGHHAAGKTHAFVETSHVRFRAVTEGEIAEYARRVHVLDKAGAYAAQEDPIGLIAEITGSRTNVIGLPMERLIPALARFECLQGVERSDA